MRKTEGGLTFLSTSYIYILPYEVFNKIKGGFKDGNIRALKEKDLGTNYASMEKRENSVDEQMID